MICKSVLVDNEITVFFTALLRYFDHEPRSNKTSVKLHIHHFAGALSPHNMAFILSVMMIVLLNSEHGAGEEEYKCGRCLIGNEGSIKKQWLHKIKKNIRYLK